MMSRVQGRLGTSKWTYYRCRWLIKLRGEQWQIERHAEEIERVTGPCEPANTSE